MCYYQCLGGFWVPVPSRPRQPASGRRAIPVAHLSWFVPPAQCPELPLPGKALMGQGVRGVGDLAPPAPHPRPATSDLGSPLPVLAQPPPLSPGTSSRCHSGCLPRTSLGTSHSPCPKLPLASSPDLLLLSVPLSGLAPLSTVFGTKRRRLQASSVTPLPPST